MSETLQVIRERRSCKSYKPDMIPEEVIQTIAEAGTWAPSGMGRPVRYHRGLLPIKNCVTGFPA